MHASFTLKPMLLPCIRNFRNLKVEKLLLQQEYLISAQCLPLEITFFLVDYFKKRGIWDKVDLHYTYPIGRVHKAEPVANWAAPEFDKLGITYETLFNMKEIRAGKSFK